MGFHYSPLSWKSKKRVLLIASYLFYAAWNPPFVLLLWLSTIVDWFLAKKIDQELQPFKRKLFLIGSLTVNLGLLGFFKYGGFALDNMIVLFNSMGIEYQPARFNIILPVGISFYTFQTLSYTLDIYRRKMKPWDSFQDFALFVTFFPQLVAGPIVRAVDFLPQCKTLRKATVDQLGYGLWLLVVGLFQKVVLADGIFAPFVNTVYSPTLIPATGTAWAGTIAFAGQIFCDFSGYSNCAIGVALCLGFKLPENFRSPYAAIGFSDFWKRWHISLSTWLRDYLYIPLGGNRHSTIRTTANLAMTMLLGGLWHGASWTFVVWGGLHGFYLICERFLNSLPVARWNVWRTVIGKILLSSTTFVLISLTWVFFRSKTFSHAFMMISSMMGLAQSQRTFYASSTKQWVVLGAFAMLLAVHWWNRDRQFDSSLSPVNDYHWGIRSLALASMMFAITLMPGSDDAFIYFQF